MIARQEHDRKTAEENEDTVTKTLKNFINMDEFNRSMTYNTSQNRYHKQILQLSGKEIGKLIKKEATSREQAQTFKAEESNKRSREYLRIRLADKKDEQLRVQKLNQSLEKLRRQIEQNDYDDGPSEAGKVDKIDPAVREIADLERQIESLGKAIEPIKVTEVDVYRQFKKGNFRNVELPVFKSDEEDSGTAAVAIGKSKSRFNQRVETNTKKLSLAERIELKKKLLNHNESMQKKEASN